MPRYKVWSGFKVWYEQEIEANSSEEANDLWDSGNPGRETDRELGDYFEIWEIEEEAA